MLSGKAWKHDLLLLVSLVMSFRSRQLSTIPAYNIRESVDTLCRDGANTHTPIYQMKQLRTPERYSHKPFQTHNKFYECLSTI